MKTVYLGRYSDCEPLTGPEKVADRIFSEHSKNNDTEFITYFFDGKKYGFWKKLFGFEKVSDKGMGRVVRLGIVACFFRLISMRPENIHIINFERFAVAALIYKKLFDVEVIYTVHGIAEYENESFKSVTESYRKRDRRIETALFKYCDRIVFLSEQSLRIAQKFYSIEKSKCSILPNGVDAEFCNKNESDISSPLLNIVFCGNINRREKGFEELRKIFLNEKLPARLYVVDSGRSGIEGSITFLDGMTTKELADFLKGMHIFISSSIYEPFSLSAVEAMASGLAVIASGETGMIRYIENEVNGFIYDVKEPEQIAALIRRLDNDRELLHTISSEARKICGALSWKNVYELYKELYG